MFVPLLWMSYKLCGYQNAGLVNDVMLHTSIKLMREAHCCSDGIEKAESKLFHIHGGEEERLFSIVNTLDTCGLEDSIWLLRAVPAIESFESEWVGRHFAADCVEYAAYILMEEACIYDNLVKDVTSIARTFADEQTSKLEMIRLWNSLHKMYKKDNQNYLIRAVRGCIFPNSVSEAARLASICSARAVGIFNRGDPKWQVDAFQRRLNY